MQIYIYTCIDTLQPAVQLIQQWLTVREIPKILYFLIPQGWMSQLIFSICWNPEEIGSNANEGLDELTKKWAHKRWTKWFLFICPYSLSTAVVPPPLYPDQRCVFFSLKLFVNGIGLPISKFQTRSGLLNMTLITSKNNVSHVCPPLLELKFIPVVIKLKIKNNHHT